jgi:hypothetical protein
MCLINPDIDAERLMSAVAATLKASTPQDLDVVIDYMRQGVRSEFVKAVMEHVKNVDAEKSAALYSITKGYLYLAYLSSVIEKAVDGITSAPYAAGYYYPGAECCTAINMIKSMWLHFLATTNIPLRDAAKAWLSAVTYEAPCRVPAAAVAALRNMKSYITALALDASL